MTEPTFFLSELLHDPVTPRTYTADEVDAMLERLQHNFEVFARRVHENYGCEQSAPYAFAAGRIAAERMRHFPELLPEGVL